MLQFLMGGDRAAAARTSCGGVEEFLPASSGVEDAPMALIQQRGGEAGQHRVELTGAAAMHLERRGATLEFDGQPAISDPRRTCWSPACPEEGAFDQVPQAANRRDEDDQYPPG